jgi:aldehyde dehydrogenase (NAD+)
MDGPEAGAPLVAHPDVGVLSFTGSSAVGRERIVATPPLKAARVVENPLVVCDDDPRRFGGLLSAFSNAGQRCAAGSGLWLTPSANSARLLEATSKLRVGPADETTSAQLSMGGNLKNVGGH